MLTEQQGHILLRLARCQIENHLEVKGSSLISPAEFTQPNFLKKRGVFVTLHKQDALRGCIGSLAAVNILEGIKHNALHAAFQDYRFEPLAAAELPDIHIEISLLTVPQPLAYETADELTGRLRPGIDGVIIKGPGNATATFLPQVWQQLPTPQLFLGHLCRKAGLAEDAWCTGNLQVLTYQVQSFEEPRQAEIK